MRSSEDGPARQSSSWSSIVPPASTCQSSRFDASRKAPSASVAFEAIVWGSVFAAAFSSRIRVAERIEASLRASIFGLDASNDAT
jgi:hypothetical protein